MNICFLIVLLLIYYYFLIINLDNSIDKFYSKNIGKFPKVYDVGFKYMPKLELSIMHFNLLMLLFCIPLFMNLNLCKEFLGFIIIIFLIRSIIIQLTILPKEKNCNTKQAMKQIGGCYDKIFSGHYAIIFLLSILYYKYNLLPLSVIVGINIFAIFLMLGMRWHYIIDLLVAMMVVVLVYQNNLRII